MKKWRSQLAALIVALAAGLSVDAIACRLLRALDDDDPWGAGALNPDALASYRPTFAAAMTSEQIDNERPGSG